MELENQIDDLNRNKVINDKKLAQALILNGKIPQLEMERAEFNKKVEKYNITIESLQKNLDNVTITFNTYITNFRNMTRSRP